MRKKTGILIQIRRVAAFCIIVFFIVIFLSFSGKLTSQDTADSYDKVYGLDQTLCNGTKYNYFPGSGMKGDQYLVSPFYMPGTVMIRGKVYRNLSLNYDLYHQQLLLKYSNEMGALNIIEVSKAWLEGFKLGEMNFTCLQGKTEPQFYQELGEGPFRIFYQWSKTIKLNTSIIGNSEFSFTPAERKGFVFMNGQLKPYGTKRSFLDLFDPLKRTEIKGYMRRNKINLRKSPDRVIEEMIIYIGKIR